MTKVRRIDWSPDEYIGGTFGNLTVDEHGAYIIALNMIYSNGAPIDLDLSRFAHAGRSRPQHMRALLDRLVAKGKLRFLDDGRLANGRAELELDKAEQRIDAARKAGLISGSTRLHRAVLKKKSANRSDLRERPFVSSTTKESSSSSISTGAARDPAPVRAAPGRAHAKPELTPPPAPSEQGAKINTRSKPKPDPRLEALAAKARARFLKGEP